MLVFKRPHVPPWQLLLINNVRSAEVDRAYRTAAAGAIDALAETLRAHVQHPKVLRQALYALGAMVVCRYPPADVTLPQKLHAAQAAQAVAAAMRTDITQQDLQTAAASAIEGITQNNNGGVGAAIAQQFLDAGVGEVLIEALTASTAHGTARFTLKALTALAHHGGSAAQLMSAVAAAAIMAAVGKLCTRGGTLSAVFVCLSVLSAAMWAIAALATKAPAESARFYAAGACQAVVRAVQLFKDVHRRSSWFWQHPGLEALAALAAAAEAHSQDMALSLVQAGACEVATAVLNAVLLVPLSDAGYRMLTSALQAICTLSADASAAARLSAAGAREAVASAIPRCREGDDAAARAAQLALHRLAAGAANAASERGSWRSKHR
ncbi:hypothetical protein JKP88DRAFT_255577 [Tribonema minus]|uniref:Uncharacterized protein n=1 Tax=Tribonema minus TaxID=303371 RepID=A0A835Z8E0_9STRA|nr:hypothetical protein JKP88DRAFT_255577 [Tribonema minus]